MGTEQSAEPRRGFRESVRSFLRASTDHASARASLLLIEASEARGTSSTISRFAGVGLVAIAAGYALLLTAAAHWAGLNWFEGQFFIPAAILAALHLFTGIVLIVAARNRLRRAKLFSETLEQFQKDRQWLDQIHGELTKSS
jgi:uncharacterized membrane protein YqjE